MPKITFIEFNGTEHVLDAPVSPSLMQVALDHMVPGVVGDCGGLCACATCHGYIDPAWVDKLPPKKDDEISILTAASEPREESRLLCQVRWREELDGIVVRLPQSQF